VQFLRGEALIMADVARDAALRKLRSPLADQSDHKVKSPDEPGAETLGWSEMGFLWEGVAFASRALRATTNSVTKTYDLGPRGAWILNLLSHDVAYPLDLARLLCVGRSLITAELTRLTDAGLVTTKPGETDRRRTELTLTPAGTIACQTIRDEMAASVRHNLANYSAQEIKLLSHMLRDLRRGAEEAGSDF
jgi:DNA-binding MarR family transcriptional regulator